jgi:hypothetical protein
MLNELTIVTHTHTDCKQLWGPYFDSYEKFFKHDKHIVLINEYSNELSNKQMIYSEQTRYSNRIIECLSKIDTEYVLIDFEDMFLYDYVKTDELKRIIDSMTINKDFLFTRLIKSGIKSNETFGEKLFYINNDVDFLFSITPTIWRTSKLLELLLELPNLTIWELEINGSKLFKNKGIKSLYYYDNDKPRGGHYDSTIYPHICSAILKGKWNLSEYPDIITPIIEKYKININERGFC